MSQTIRSQNVKPQTLGQASPDRSSRAPSTPISATGSTEQAANSQSQDVPSLATTMNVDALLDEVFGDIERMLEPDSSPTRPLATDSAPANPHSTAIAPFSAATQSPEPASADATAIPSAMTNAMTSTSTSEAISSKATSLLSPLAANLTSPSSSLALLPKLSPRQLKPDDSIDPEVELFPDLPEVVASPARPLDLLLMFLALISLISAAGLWIFVRTKLPQLTQVANTPSTAEVLQAKHDAEFLDYVRRSLERIDRSKPMQSTADSRPATALDPLFVPLPPPPPIAVAPPIAAVPTPSISVSPLPMAPVPSVAPAIAPSSSALSASPPTDSIAAAPVPATPSIPNIAPSPTHTLIGLLELGDRSAALFEIDGTPQRIQVGEKFGASGWTLISVSGDEAIVRRNGDVRSVLIGQKF